MRRLAARAAADGRRRGFASAPAGLQVRAPSAPSRGCAPCLHSEPEAMRVFCQQAIDGSKEPHKYNFPRFRRQRVSMTTTNCRDVLGRRTSSSPGLSPPWLAGPAPTRYNCRSTCSRPWSSVSTPLGVLACSDETPRHSPTSFAITRALAVTAASGQTLTKSCGAVRQRSVLQSAPQPLCRSNPITLLGGPDCICKLARGEVTGL